MSTHTISELNALQAGLHDPTISKCEIEIQKWATPHFKENDHFVTLTYRQYATPYEVERSADVRHFLKRLNRKVYGKAYQKGFARLKTFPVFELNKSGGMHIHMAIGRPTDIKLEKSMESLAIETWIEMKCGGSAKGQDVRNCTEIMGLIKYCSKQIKLNDKLLMLDVLNIHWPL